MRKLKECQAEVFRRSAEKIKARKQRRKRLLIAGVPTALCVCVIAVGAFLGTEDTKGNEGVRGDVHYSSSSSVVEKVLVAGAGIDEVYTDGERISGVLSLLHNTETAKEMDNLTAAVGVTGADGSANEQEYTVTLVNADGSQTAYRLTGKKLINQETKETITLTKRQLKELRELLEIPE